MKVGVFCNEKCALVKLHGNLKLHNVSGEMHLIKMYLMAMLIVNFDVEIHNKPRRDDVAKIANLTTRSNRRPGLL